MITAQTHLTTVHGQPPDQIRTLYRIVGHKSIALPWRGEGMEVTVPMVVVEESVGYEDYLRGLKSR